MSYSGFITKLKGLHPHSNADRLQVAECFGNSVIIGLDMVENQTVVYFPVDGQLSEEFAVKHNLLRKKDVNGNNIGGYLDADKRNITALKLRGEKSDGLVLPIESLSDYCNIKELTEGQLITTLGGVEICRKYIPFKLVPNGHGSGGLKLKKKKKITVFPFFEEHIDTAQLSYNMGSFRQKDTCYLTLKCHGTSGRTSNAYFTKTKPQNFFGRLFKRKPKTSVGHDYITGTRRVVLENYEGGFYGDNAFRQKYHDFFKGKLFEGETVYYEIVGYTDTGAFIMEEGDNTKVDKMLGTKEFTTKYGPKTQFTYGCEPKQNDIYIYRITLTTPQGTVIEYPWEQLKNRADQMGVKHVPELDKFLFKDEDDLMERVNKHIGGEDPIGKSHVREGTVVRIDNKSKFTAFKAKNFEFKVLEGIIKSDSTEPDMEEAQEI